MKLDLLKSFKQYEIPYIHALQLSWMKRPCPPYIRPSLVLKNSYGCADYVFHYREAYRVYFKKVVNVLRFPISGFQDFGISADFC